MWGHRKVFHGFLRVMGFYLWVLLKGFLDGLYCFSDFSDSCQFYTETVILLKTLLFVIVAFLIGLQTV